MKKTLLLFIVFVGCLFLLKVLNRTPEKTCQTATLNQSIVPAVQEGREMLEPAAESHVIGIVVPASVEVTEKPAAQPVKPVDIAAKTRTIEKTIKSGNKGYMVRDKDYVYFGITKKVVEEVPAEQ